MFELVIVRDDGGRSIYEYPDRESAERGQGGMLTALGNQIKWSGIRRKI